MDLMTFQIVKCKNFKNNYLILIGISYFSRRDIEFREFTDKIHLTVSIGIEVYSGENVSNIIKKVDEKLYVAKNSGRNKTVM